MPGDRQTVHDRVLQEYDVLYGSRPDHPGDVTLGDEGAGQVSALVENLRDALGIPSDEAPPDGTLDDLIDYLHERWDGVTMDDEDA
ncbi:MAG TPA: hypothetical protein RMH99_07720 [Sandaracinaceae bacterium LLY-WYZ-13_1]|nr:hypothetical protein [Sandaracinaceae bacterium LLY-WYZ-13_1]